MTRFYVTMLSLCVVLGFGVVSKALAADWSSFNDASFTGISITPTLASGTLSYTLLLGSNPTILIGATTSNINWIQALYVVSKLDNQKFTATEGSNNNWNWEAKGSTNIAGWHGQGNNRVLPSGSSETVHYSSLNYGSNEVQWGFHIGYASPGSNQQENSGWFKGSVVPEPSSLFGLGTALIGTFGLYSGRRNRRI